VRRQCHPARTCSCHVMPQIVRKPHPRMRQCESARGAKPKP
jgi:hypothetical protein